MVWGLLKKDGKVIGYYTKGMPARPFMYPALKDNEDQINKNIAKDLKKAIKEAANDWCQKDYLRGIKEDLREHNGYISGCWKKFPCIQFLEEENIPQEITDDTERMSYIRYKVDIWDKVSTTAAALQVNAVFAGLGLNRSSSVDVPEQSYLKHKMMRFEGVVDHDTLIVYQK